jgi:hypothetical protein
LSKARAPGIEEAIGYLRARHIELVYDRECSALRADVPGATPIIVDRQAGWTIAGLEGGVP